MIGLLALGVGCLLHRPTLGLGAGAAFPPATLNGSPDPVATPALSFDSAHAPGEGPLGYTHHQTVTVHDWRAIGEVWRWYGRGPGPDVEPELQALWYVLLSPAALMAPLAGSEITTRPGLIVRTGAASGARLPWFELGPSIGLWLNPSSRAAPADLAAGGWAGIGIDLGDQTSLSLRSGVELPVFQALANRRPSPIVTGGLVVSLRPERAAEQPAADPQPEAASLRP